MMRRKKKTTEITNTNEEVIRRNLEKLRREMGTEIRNAMDDPSVIEIMLNPDGKVWIDKIGSGMEFLCYMSPVQALQMLGTVAHMLGTVINYHHPIQCRHNILSHKNIAPICTEAMNEEAFFA